MPPFASTATPPGATSESETSVFTPFLTTQSAPVGGNSVPRTSAPASPSFAISSTYIAPSGPNARSITDENPVATLLQPPLGFTGSQTASTLPGAIRQIRAAPFVNGNPVSSET